MGEKTADSNSNIYQMGKFPPQSWVVSWVGKKTQIVIVYIYQIPFFPLVFGWAQFYLIKYLIN